MLHTFILIGCCCCFVILEAQRHPQPDDYPGLRNIPRTSFDCKKRPVGYYADPDPTTKCQVYHMCDMKGNKFSYLCPNGTLFHQQHLICAHWYQVNCTRTLELYKINKQMFPFEKFDSGIIRNNVSSAYIHPAYAAATSQRQLPVVPEPAVRDAGAIRTPEASVVAESNSVNGKSRFEADIHVAVPSAQAILLSPEQPPIQPPTHAPRPIWHQPETKEVTTTLPPVRNFRGRTKFSHARSRSDVVTSNRKTSSGRFQGIQSRINLPTLGPQANNAQTAFGSRSAAGQSYRAVTRSSLTSFKRFEAAQTSAAQEKVGSSNPAIRSRVALVRSTWTVPAPALPSGLSDQSAIPVSEEVPIEQESTSAIHQTLKTTTPWTSLRATHWPLVRQGISSRSAPTTSPLPEQPAPSVSADIPFGETTSDVTEFQEKKLKPKLTMRFPKGGFFKKYSILPLNEKCPLCNPYFLKNGQCFPCVTIR